MDLGDDTVVPTPILEGDLDPRTPVATAREIAGTLSVAKVVVVDSSGARCPRCPVSQATARMSRKVIPVRCNPATVLRHNGAYTTFAQLNESIWRQGRQLSKTPWRETTDSRLKSAEEVS
jgi:hypothetical protein